MAMIYVPVPRKEVDHGRRNRDTVVARAPYHLSADQGRGLFAEPRALFVSPLFFGAARGSRKALTPGTRRFPCVFHYFTSQSHENHDFYPTPPLHGVSIAMYTRALVEETSRLCGSQPRSLCLLGQRSRILPP